MSLSICSITGQPLSQPMASLKTGHLFERQVIIKHLNSFPYCPITNQPMSKADLIAVKPYQGDFVGQNQSVMTYISKIQEQHNLLQVQAFELRKHLQQTQQQLTNSLYGNLAATRVIARLLKQKQLDQKQIGQLQTRLTAIKNGIQ